MDRTELKKEMSETEALDADGAKVADLLRALPRVEAPDNFEFGVKAKIASGYRPTRRNLLPFFKVTAPLGLVLLVVASVVFYGTRLSDSNSAPLADAQPAQHLPPSFFTEEKRIDVPPPAQEVEQVETRTPKANVEPRRSGPIRETIPVASRARNLGGGSVDKGVAVAEVIEPPGFKSGLGRNRNADSDGPGAATGIPIAEILETLGLNAKFIEGGWKVQSIRQNSIGNRSGVQVNDVIEALGDQVLGASTSLKGGFDGKSLLIRRGDKRISLSVKN